MNRSILSEVISKSAALEDTVSEMITRRGESNEFYEAVIQVRINGSMLRFSGHGSRPGAALDMARAKARKYEQGLSDA